MDARGGAAMSRAADQAKSGCPFHQNSKFSEWLDTGLRCSAGKREFNLDRYHVAPIAGGADFSRELEHFRREVIEYRKVGFLAICTRDMSAFKMAEDELWVLGSIMRDAGFTPSVASLISGDTIAIPFEFACPVTGEETVYEFFPVAFCRGSANPDDPLYDPSLSVPFTAINTTSDAFGFGMLVRDLVMKHLGRAPAEVSDRHAMEKAMHRAVQVWQNMSVNTIQSYNKAAGNPRRAVQLSEDRKFWIAPHNDPVFAELQKREHSHEMPTVYAERLCRKWLGVMFDDKPALSSRDGQSGGRPIFHREHPGHELHQF
jgi:hypothetical protein